MKLQHTDSQGQLTGNYVYVVPRLVYNIRLNGPGVGSGNGPRDSYSGVFFERAAGLVDRSTWGNSAWNICMTPPPGVFAPSNYGVGTKHSRSITISIAGPLELYATKAMQPGRYSYKGRPLYIGSFAGYNEADSYAPLNIMTDLNVVRICKITNVSQSNFNIVVGRETEVIKDSRFSYTCTADNKAIFISALAREGEVDGSNPSKLWFQRINGSRTANTPFLLGLPYGSGSDSSLTCQDVGKAGLLTFNNQEKTLLGKFS